MKNRILFAPVHYIYADKGWGSEISWAYNIANRLCSYYADSVIVTGSSTVPITKYRIFELQKGKKYLDLGILNALSFNLKYTYKIYTLIRSKSFDLHHHVLPFGINTTFNLAILFCKSTPVIIGPIQSPLLVADTDLGSTMTMEQNAVSKKQEVLNYLIVPFRGILKWLSRETLKKADAIVVVNNATKKLICALGIKESKITIIPPGIDTSLFPYIKRNKKLKTLKIITTNKLLKRKRVDLILKAIVVLIERNEEVFLDIIGDGPQRDNLEKLSKNLKLDKYVRFLGYVNHINLKEHYNNADLFVSMSESESWGQVYLEAMACGVPIITTRNTGADEIIKPSFGYLLKQNDYMSLANYITKLSREREKLNSMGKKAREEVELRYDWEKSIIPQYQKVYNDLLNTYK